MKRLLFLFSFLFCTASYADTQNLKFVVDNETYYTSTCTVGENVTLPADPIKTGYDFEGWQQVFNRGTFANWAAIPNAAGGYLSDTNGSSVPKENDYIIVNDASGVPEYGENIEIQVSTDSYTNIWTNYCRTYINEINYGCNISAYNNAIRSFYYVDNKYRIIYQSDTKKIMRKGVIYTPGNQLLNLVISTENNGTYYAKFINGYPYSGKWLLRYHGNWDDLGRGGWIAEKQLN